MNVALLTETNASRTFLHRLDPRLKWVAVIVMIAVAASVRPSHPHAIFALGISVILLFTLARVSVRHVCLRLIPLIPFVLLSALSMVWQHSCLAASFVIAKSILCLLIGFLLVATTPMRTLVTSLRWFHAPELLVALLAFTLRFLFVLQEETLTMHHAYLSRCGRVKDLRHTRFLGAMIASLFLRTCRRSERIHAAMLSRNFDGHLPAFRHKPLTWREVAPLMIFLTSLIAMGVIGS